MRIIIVRSLLLCALFFFLGSAQFSEAFQIQSDEKFSLDMDMEIGSGIFAVSDDYSGKNQKDVMWEEACLKFGLSGTYKISPNQTWKYLLKQWYNLMG